MIDGTKEKQHKTTDTGTQYLLKAVQYCSVSNERS